MPCAANLPDPHPHPSAHLHRRASTIHILSPDILVKGAVSRAFPSLVLDVTDLSLGKIDKKVRNEDFRINYQVVGCSLFLIGGQGRSTGGALIVLLVRE